MAQFRKLPVLKGYFEDDAKPTRQEFQWALQHRADYMARRGKPEWLDGVLERLAASRKKAKEARALKTEEAKRELYLELAPGTRVGLRRRRGGRLEFGIVRAVHGTGDIEWDRVAVRPSKKVKGETRPCWNDGFAKEAERVQNISSLFVIPYH